MPPHAGKTLSPEWYVFTQVLLLSRERERERERDREQLSFNG